MDSDNEILMEFQRIMSNPDQNIKPEVVNQLIAAILINLDRRLRRIEKVAPVITVILWIGSAIGISIVGLIWSVIVGQASIIFN